MGLRLGIKAPGSIKRPRQSQARWAVGLQTGVSLLESLELSDVVSVVSSYHDGSSHLGLDNPFALFWFLNRDFYLVQMKNPRGWILEFILRTPTSRSESKTSSKSKTPRSLRRRMWDHDLFLVLVILNPEAPTKPWGPTLASMPKFYLIPFSLMKYKIFLNSNCQIFREIKNKINRKAIETNFNFELALEMSKLYQFVFFTSIINRKEY